MKRILILILLLVPVLVHAQDLVNDTIKTGNTRMILSLPQVSIKWVKIDRYEEGFFRYYTIDSAYAPFAVIVHFGALAEMVLPEPDSVIYKCKLGNIANSFYFISDGKYFRRDTYNSYGIRVFFYGVEEDDLELANYILDNLKISKVSKN